jgi:DNA-directed RNA polymerase specialized sigma24 family protein
MLRARQARREQLSATWKPLVSEHDDPEQASLHADAVGIALLVVLDGLEPAERLAVVLHDMFGVPFEQVATVVGRTPAATGQPASRARRRLRERAPQPHTGLPAQRRVVDERVSVHGEPVGHEMVRADVLGAASKRQCT